MDIEDLLIKNNYAPAKCCANCRHSEFKKDGLYHVSERIVYFQTRTKMYTQVDPSSVCDLFEE